MKLGVSGKTDQALTLVEVLVIVAVLFFLFIFVYYPGMTVKDRNSAGPRCVNNLKQVGLAYRIWAGDHNDRFPTELSVTNGGTMELMETADAWRIFQVMSNELSSPGVIYCRADDEHPMYATNFSDDLKGKISYFAGLDADTNLPLTFLSGDDNFLIAGQPAARGLLNLASNAPVTWSAARHHSKGYVGLGDGSVQSLSNRGLVIQLDQTGLATNRLVIP